MKFVKVIPYNALSNPAYKPKIPFSCIISLAAK